MQSVVLVNQRWRNFPEARYMFEDNTFNTTSGTFVDTGVTITPDNGINLVFARANSSGGSEGVDAGVTRVTYDGVDIGRAELFLSDQGGHWNANDMGMLKLVDSSGTGDLKIQAHRTGGGRSIDVGSQQLLTIPLETMGLVEGVDYWQGEFHEGTGPTDPFKWDTGLNWLGADALTSMVEIARLDFTAPETEIYFLFFSWESAMTNPVVDAAYAVYPMGTSTDRIRSCSITSSGTTATVTLVDHGYQDNHQTKIAGANQSEYNGVFIIDKLTDDTFRYQMSGSTSSPATGTITEQKEPVSESSNVNHVTFEGTGGVLSFQSQCWISVRTMNAGLATAALVGRVWQSAGQDVAVRRARIIAIRASSLTAGWLVGSQQKSKFFQPPEWDPRNEGNGDTFAEITNYTQTYTPPGPASEQTLFFWMSVNTADGGDITPPRSTTTFKIVNVTDSKDFAVDMGRPLPQLNNLTWCFGMGVRDNNSTSSQWQIHGREANNTGNVTRHRNGYFIVMGLKNV